MEPIDIIQHFQELLKNQSAVLTETDKQVIEEVIKILKTEPSERVDWESILKMILQILSIGSQFLN